MYTIIAHTYNATDATSRTGYADLRQYKNQYDDLFCQLNNEASQSLCSIDQTNHVLWCGCILTSLYVKRRLNLFITQSEVNPFNWLFNVQFDLIENEKIKKYFKECSVKVVYVGKE